MGLSVYNFPWKVYPTFLIGACLLSACSDLQEVPLATVKKDDFVYAADILYSAECELFEAVDAVSENNATSGFRFVDAVATFTLTVVELNSSGSNFTFIVPLANAGIGLSGSASSSGSSTRKMEFQVSFVESERPNCDKPVVGVNRIESGLGLSQWIGAMAEILVKTDEAPTSATYDVSFNISKPRSVGLSGKRTVSSTDSKSLAFSASTTRTTNHRLVITSKISRKSAVNKKRVSQSTQRAADSYLQRRSIE